MPTPSVLPTMLAVPDAVVGIAVVVTLPRAGLPLTMFERSYACSTYFKLASDVEVIVTPSELRISSVNPVVNAEMTGGRVTETVILSEEFFEVIVGPPPLSDHMTVSEFHEEPTV